MSSIDIYQQEAVDTQQFESNTDKAISIALMGLSGEVGELITEYKKKIRDGESYSNFRAKVEEELGDIFWYLASIAAHEGLKLSDVLEMNLKKVKDRWHDIESLSTGRKDNKLLDEYCLDTEKLPRNIVLEFKEKKCEVYGSIVELLANGSQFGDPLTDNSYDPDFYRYHDIFHFSYATVLGWSPIVRGFFHKKRKNDKKKDEVEDGGRAKVIDEAISVLVFEYAKHHNFFKGVGAVDYELLRNIRILTRNIEVGKCSMKQWEDAILLGFKMWHLLKENQGGKVFCSLEDRTMKFKSLDKELL